MLWCSALAYWSGRLGTIVGAGTTGVGIRFGSTGQCGMRLLPAGTRIRAGPEADPLVLGGRIAPVFGPTVLARGQIVLPYRTVLAFVRIGPVRGPSVLGSARIGPVHGRSVLGSARFGPVRGRSVLLFARIGPVHGRSVLLFARIGPAWRVVQAISAHKALIRSRGRALSNSAPVRSRARDRRSNGLDPPMVDGNASCGKAASSSTSPGSSSA